MLVQEREQLLAPVMRLAGDHLQHALMDCGERLRRGSAVSGGLREAALHLLFEAGHPDLEKLVQIRADDAEELHPLEQGVPRVDRLVEHALVELQPAELSGNIVRGRAGLHCLTLNLDAESGFTKSQSGLAPLFSDPRPILA